jgi:hypothetical protein
MGHCLALLAGGTLLRLLLCCRQERTRALRPGTRSGDRGAVFLADAARLHRAFILSGRSPVQARDLIALSTFASCVLCCPMHEQPSGLAGLQQFLRTYHPDAFRGSRGDHVPNRGLREGPLPAYVQQVLEGDRAFVGFADDHAPVDGIGALLLFDLRGDHH